VASWVARVLRLTDAGRPLIGPRDVGMRRSPDGVRVRHGAARCGHNCGHAMTARRPKAGGHLTPRSTQPLFPALDLRRDPTPHCAGGAMLSSPLSSARHRVLALPVIPSARRGSFMWRRSQRRSCTLGLCRILSTVRLDGGGTTARHPRGSPLDGPPRASSGSAPGMSCGSPRVGRRAAAPCPPSDGVL
jgi:hypothetical protein